MAARRPVSQFPTSIHILGASVRVELVADLEDEGIPLDGFFSTIHGLSIKINSALSTPKRYSTLLHESMHAAIYLSGLSELLREELEEATVMCLETHLVQLMQELGPVLVEHLHVKPE